MIDILHAFAVGISFSVGVVTGTVLCAFASKSNRKEFADDWKDQQKRIEDRLMGSLECHKRIADSLEVLTERESTKDPQ